MSISVFQFILLPTPSPFPFGTRKFLFLFFSGLWGTEMWYWLRWVVLA